MASAGTVFLDRINFGLITSLHIVWPPLTIGLSALLLYWEWRWLKTGHPEHYRARRFFEKIFLVNFAVGVVTGVTMEMAFGMFFGPFAKAAGPVFGPLLGIETISAFMVEASFIGLMVFGWGRMHKRMHLLATAMVAVTTSLSAVWITTANSWMQTPTGVTLRHDQFNVTSWSAALANPDMGYAVPHMLVACVLSAVFVVGAISAWSIAHGRAPQMFARALKFVILVGLIAVPVQLWLGDSLGLVVAHDQPAALAAMEGHWHTNAPGQPAGWNVLAVPDAAKGKNSFAVQVPYMLSLLETHSLTGQVRGLDSFTKAHRPDVWVPFYGFRAMVGIWALMLALLAWSAWRWWRNGLSTDALRREPWLIRAWTASALLPYLAIWAGWWTREEARQPWVVYGLMTTSQGASHLSVAELLAWMGAILVFALLAWGVAWIIMVRIVRDGPSAESGPDQPEQAQSPPGHTLIAGAPSEASS
ncbi:MAG TPA: cytochrome ubiquinol oxidase subunit I [Gammaproteobacteria bacterium]|nr:cytochrome ubiquinol oxidase subunit I [Gammaproteobacteria bacterium]